MDGNANEDAGKEFFAQLHRRFRPCRRLIRNNRYNDAGIECETRGFDISCDRKAAFSKLNSDGERPG